MIEDFDTRPLGETFRQNTGAPFLTMAAIVRRVPDEQSLAPAAVDPWPGLAATASVWLDEVGVEPREAIVLLPFASLLPHARRAFAVRSGWMPRIETTETMAASLGPAAPAGEGPSFDVVHDRLCAARLLRSQREGGAWERRDRRGFERATRDVVVTAHALLRAAAAVPPVLRDAHWALARQTLVPAVGPGGLERSLARLALEWAVLAPAPSTDRLFDLRPAAWIVVRAGGAQALAERLLAASAAPALVVDTDTDPLAPFGNADPASPPVLAVCGGFEHEAQATAAQVVEHLRAGQVPVALIAQDRVLVRRVRALLQRHAVALLDETGWRLSTTRAAALVMGALRAVPADAPSDAVLDWLKMLPDRDAAFRAALDALERRLRRHGLAGADAVDRHFAAEPDASPESRLWAEVVAWRGRLGATGRRPLAEWLRALRDALVEAQTWSALAADAAGVRVAAALRLADDAVLDAHWHGTALSLAGFTDWVDSALETETFRPAADAGVAPQVVVTPMARAMLRPFAAIVLPGADDRHLGAPAAAESLLSAAQARALGVPDREDRRRDETLAFAQLLRTPALTLLRRRAEGGELLADSPLVARLALALARRGSRLGRWRDPRAERVVAPTPIVRPAPGGVGALLPSSVSASAYDALRSCPYRFFALRLLRLGDADELDGEVEKRDYGTWLHWVLHAFHAERTAPRPAADEVRRLMELADASRLHHALPEADLLPFLASFDSLAPRYVAWLHARDAAGWRWVAGEREFVVALPGGDGISLRGIVDRIDVGPDGGETVTELIDYKTGSSKALAEKVAQPFEDTQLAFYAALVGDDHPVRAMYLALDDARRLPSVVHRDPSVSAEALRAGLLDDLTRIRAGAGLAALGAGEACRHCDARGLCRRDHWSTAGAAPARPPPA